MMATQARGGKPKNPMPTVIVVEGTKAKALRALSGREPGGPTPPRWPDRPAHLSMQIPRPRQILRRACRTSH
jgi:hypothetical protein